MTKTIVKFKPATLDTYGDLGRVCPCCHHVFRADHRNMKFCSIKCHDDYNNRLKKETRIQKKIDDEIELQKREEERQIFERNQALQNNLDLCKKLNVGTNGKTISFEEANELGFNFNFFSDRNSRSEREGAYWLIFGPYSLERIDDLKIHITVKA